VFFLVEEDIMVDACYGIPFSPIVLEDFYQLMACLFLSYILLHHRW